MKTGEWYYQHFPFPLLSPTLKTKANKLLINLLSATFCDLLSLRLFQFFFPMFLRCLWYFSLLFLHEPFGGTHHYGIALAVACLFQNGEANRSFFSLLSIGFYLLGILL